MSSPEKQKEKAKFFFSHKVKDNLIFTESRTTFGRIAQGTSAS